MLEFKNEPKASFLYGRIAMFLSLAARLKEEYDSLQKLYEENPTDTSYVEGRLSALEEAYTVTMVGLLAEQTKLTHLTIRLRKGEQ